MSDITATESVRSAVALFPRDLSSVARAREWLSELVDHDRVTPKQADDAVLLMSEMVTNALRHGDGDVVCHGTVDLERGEVRIGVTDAGDGSPRLRSVDPKRVGGIGLMLVERLAQRWGVASFPGGKVVWAVLAGA